MKKVFFALLLLLLVLSSVVIWRLFIPLDREVKQGELWDIPPGKSFYRTAEELKTKGFIRSAWEMKVLIWLFRSPPLLKGEYLISPSAESLWRIFQKLKKGEERIFFVRFPEGFNHYEMAQLLKSQNWPAWEDFFEKIHDKSFIQKNLQKNIQEELSSLEGYLFPDSYRLRKYMSAESLIQLMLKRFFEVYEKAIQFSSESSLKLNRHEQVTLASLIEKETGQAEERPLIAGVFYNRLRRKMKLQTDPSILYALYLQKGFDWGKNIRKKDILFPSPYNTYVVGGLPPGPIANPGFESLKAVFKPQKNDFLYFVSRNDGSHKFSKNYREHKKAVYKYQIKPFKKKTLTRGAKSSKQINP